MNERGYTVRFMKRVEEVLPASWMWKVSDRFRGGIPDLEILNNAITVRIEFKVDKHKLERLQIIEINALRRAGATVLVVRFLNKERNFSIENGRDTFTSESYRSGNKAADGAAELIAQQYL